MARMLSASARSKLILLSSWVVALLRGAEYNAVKKSHGGSRRGRKPKGQSDPLNSTARQLAEKYGVSEKTVRRYRAHGGGEGLPAVDSLQAHEERQCTPSRSRSAAAVRETDTSGYALQPCPAA